ncbi:type I polyketide synthase [Streptoalloteichus hindustanus]|uniref:Acyl transferase domain-containing protein n=1 Tax=Streptoalloteichus hindustanus TaxID=2017 RepID=A0A1M5PR31_STRHI|nr:type I polyketide synthase [Streptoalloteichus hindustanus]SHH04218.1 Acyl transferase domain-containing protein [Streptoalloteichus hindustanus]
MSAAESAHVDRRLARDPVAVVGVAGVFPGARDVREFWTNVVAGADCTSAVPGARWRVPGDLGDTGNPADPEPGAESGAVGAVGPGGPGADGRRRAGVLPEVTFDPLEFGMPADVAASAGVARLLSLVVARDALRDAGCDVAPWYDPARTGVVLGCSGGGAGGELSVSSAISAWARVPVLRGILREAGFDERRIDEIANRVGHGSAGRAARDARTTADTPDSGDTANFSEATHGRRTGERPPDTALDTDAALDTALASWIASRFDLGGLACAVDAAGASSLAAVRVAVGELVERRADLMIAGGCDVAEEPAAPAGPGAAPTLSATQVVRPFDANADGTLLGEGVGMVALKRLADAERDGDRVYAVIRGMGHGSDARGATVHAPSLEGQLVTLRRAYEDADCPPRSVALFEAHGTGTPGEDEIELRALHALTSGTDRTDRTDPPAPPGSSAPPAPAALFAVGSVKSQIGHTGAAAGAAGLVKLALALHHRVLPPTVNVDRPAEAALGQESPLYVNTETRPWIGDPRRPVRRAAVSAFGAGGASFHVVLDEHEPSAGLLQVSHACARVHLWHAPDVASLRAAVAEGPGLSTTTPVPEDRLRAGFVSRDPAEFAELRALLLDRLREWDGGTPWQHRRGVHLRPSGLPESARVAALFADQGSQYVGMARTAVLAVPPARAAFDAVNQRFTTGPTLAGVVFPPPVAGVVGAAGEEARARAEELLRRPEYAQPAIGAVALGQYRFLTVCGFRPQGLLGHSFGELTALWAAGCLDDETFFQLAVARGRAMAPQVDNGRDPGAMAMVRAPAAAVDTLLAAHPDLVVCHYDAPDQLVVGGPTLAVDAFVTSCADQRIFARVLPAAAAFHTAHVQHAVDEFAAAVAAAAFRPPRVPVYANTRGARYGEDVEATRRVLVEQLRHPVDFAGRLEEMHRDGFRVFVEFGPGQALTRLVERTLGDRGVVAVATDGGPDQDSDVQLKRAGLQLALLGQPLADLNRYLAPAPERRTPSPSAVVLRRRAEAGREPGAGADGTATGAATGTAVERAAGLPQWTVPPDAAATTSVADRAPAPVQRVVGAARPAEPVATWRTTSESDAVAPPEPEPAAAAGQPADPTPDLARIAADHLALHRRYLDGQLRVAERLGSLLTRSLDTAGLAEGVTALRDHSLALGEAHIRANEALAALLRLNAEATGTSGATGAPGAAAAPAARVADPGVPTGPAPAAPRPGADEARQDPGVPAPAENNVANAANAAGVAATPRHAVPPPNRPVRPAALPAGAAPATPPQAPPQTPPPTSSQTPPAGPPPAAPPAARPPATGPRQRREAGGTGPDEQDLVARLRQLIAERAGRDPRTLEPHLDLEADLGLDSLDRVRVLGEVWRRLPVRLDQSATPTAHLTAFRTVGDALRLPRLLLQSTASPTAKPQEILRSRVGLVELPEIDALAGAFRTERIAMVVADGSDLPPALARALRERGWRVRVLALPGVPVEDPEAVRLGDWSEDSLTATLAGVLPGQGVDLCVLPIVADDEHAVPRLTHAVLTAKHVLRALTATAGAGRRAAFVTVTRLDGALGYTGSAANSSLVGGVSGLVRTLALEAPALFCRALDLAPTLPADEAARLVVAELDDVARDVVEVALDGARRRTVTAVPSPLPAREPAPPALGADDVLVVTGGGRGVTAWCVTELMRRQPCSVLVLGRTELTEEPEWAVNRAAGELPDALTAHLRARGTVLGPARFAQAVRDVRARREIRGTLAALTAAGARAEYLVVDVTDAAAVQAALRPHAHRVTAVVHGAGVLADAGLPRKNATDVERVLGVKLTGLRNVLSALDQERLRHLVLFGSAAGWFGNPGQADYAAANAALNRLACAWRARRPGCRVTAVNWGPWDGGMVEPWARAGFALRGVPLLPREAGVERFLAEFDAEESPVVLVAPAARALPPRAPAPFAGIKVERRLERLACDPVVQDHGIGGSPVLPLAAAVGWCVNVLERAHPGWQVVECRDVRLHKGVVCDGGEWSRFVLEAVPARENAFQVTIVSEDAPARSWPRYAGTFRLADRPLSAPPVRRSWARRLAELGGERAPAWYEDVLSTGPSLRGLGRLLEQDGTRLVVECRMRDVPLAHGAFAGRLHSPVLADQVLQAAMLGAARCHGVSSLPVAIERVEMFDRLPDDQPFVLEVDAVRRGAAGLSCTVVACAPDGRVYQRYTGVSMAGPASGEPSPAPALTEAAG